MAVMKWVTAIIILRINTVINAAPMEVLFLDMPQKLQKWSHHMTS